MAELKPTTESLLVEYQAAQSSAQHHDTLIWSVNAIIWAASFILWGFLLKHAADKHLKPVIVFISILGVFINVKVLIFTHQLAEVKVHKYKRCKAIENILGLKQHSTLKYISGLQRTLYSIAMALFIIVWIWISIIAITAKA